MAFSATPRHVKDVATELKEALRRKRIIKPLRECVTLAEAMFASTEPGLADQALFDDEVDEKTVRDRHRCHSKVLSSAGLADGLAASIVGRIRPTARKTKPPLLKLEPDLASVFLNGLGLAYRVGSDDLAEKLGAILLSTDISDVFDSFTEILSAFRAENPRALHHMGIATAVSKRRTADSIELLNQQLREFPDDPRRDWVVLFRGDVRSGTYGGSKDMKAAVADYEEAASLGNMHGAFAAAEFYEWRDDEDDTDKAVTMYGRAIALGSTKAKTNLAILKASREVGSSEDAQAVMSLIVSAAKDGDGVAKELLFSSFVEDLRGDGAPILMEPPPTRHDEDTRYFADEASALGAARRMADAWGKAGLAERPTEWFQEAFAATIDCKAWSFLIGDARSGKTVGQADECLDREQLVERRERQAEKLQTFAGIEWTDAMSIIDESEPTRITRGPLVLGDDYNLKYDLPPIAVDGSRRILDMDIDPTEGVVLPGKVSATETLRYSIDSDGDHVLELVEGGKAVASVTFYRSGYVDLGQERRLRLDPVSVPAVISALTVVVLKLPSKKRDNAILHLATAFASLSWRDTLWMAADHHPAIEGFSAELRGYGEDEGVEEFCAAVMSSHGMMLLKNRKDECGRSIERRMRFTGIDLYDYSAGTVFRQGDPANPDWWNPDGGQGDLEVIRGGHYQKDRDAKITSHSSPGKPYKTWLDETSDDWPFLTADDMACFTPFMNDEVPDVIYFRRVGPGAEAEYLALMAKWGHPIEPEFALEPSEPATPTFIEEVAMVGHKKRGKMEASGIYIVRHFTNIQRRHHEVEVKSLLADHQDAVVGAIASICMGIEDIKRTWPDLFGDVGRITVAIKLGDMSNDVTDWMIQSLMMRAEAWEEYEEDGEQAIDLRIYLKGGHMVPR